MRIIFLLLSLPLVLLAEPNDTWSEGDPGELTGDSQMLLKHLQIPQTETYRKHYFSIGSFAVISPYGLRRGKPFKVAINGLNVRRDKKFTIRILGTTESGIQVRIKRTGLISKAKPRTQILINTAKIPPGTYRLCVTTDGYSEEKELLYVTNEYSFLIQADRALYFPENLIRFRVFAINSETRSVNPSRQTDITIRDATGTAVTSYTNVKFIKGKFQSDFQLSKTPALGIWEIVVQSGDDISTKYIEVSGYEVPIIYVAMEVPSTVPFSFGVVPITINAKYSFNEEVDGYATVIFERAGTEYFRTKVEIHENIANVDIRLLEDLKASGEVAFDYDVRMEYFDQLTGSTVEDSATFVVVPESATLFLTGDPYLKPGELFEYSVVVQKYDGSPASAGTEVSVLISPEGVTQTLSLDDNGSAVGSYMVPLDATLVFIDATAEDASAGNLMVELAVPDQGDLSVPVMRLDVRTKQPTIDAPVDVEVALSDVTDKIVCIISAKGILLESIEVPVSVATKTAAFSFTPSFTYAPLTNILAYYVTQDGRIITATTSVELTAKLRNKVSFSVQSEKYKPGDSISINVDSVLKSTVSMGAVDQNVLKLRGSHGVSTPDVFADLMKFYSLVPFTESEEIPDYEINFNLHGLLIFTNIPATPECFQYQNLVEPAIKKQPGPSFTPNRNIKSPSNFQNTIFWNNVDILQPIPGPRTDHNLGRETVSEVATDGLASYVLYGISMSPDDGIGVSDASPSFSVFRPFFISAELPYSIKRNEILVLNIVVYNFLTESQAFDVRIPKDPLFVIDQASNFMWEDAGDHYVRHLETVVGIHSRFKFALKATGIGTANINIAAQGPLAGDEIHKVLRIESIGELKTVTDGHYFLLGDGEAESHTITCPIPAGDTYPISAAITISGDIMAAPVQNLPTGLINMPSGCGEQTMLYFVPDVVSYLYLKETDQLTDSLLNDLTYYINAGYQNELTYLRSDGAFSAFGNNYRASTWLTAYVGWSFNLAKDIITADTTDVIRRGLQFTSTKQQADGSFIESGPVIHQEMSGNADSGLAISAYVTNYITSLISDYPEFTDMHTKAVKYLEDNWWRATSTYELAIVAYALKLAGSDKGDNVINFFYMRRTETDTEIYFENVETTAYCLLALWYRDDKYDDSVKIVRYLMRIRNNFGGYFYSQDTVMAIYALSKFASRYQPYGGFSVTFTPNVGPSFTREITYGNFMNVDRTELDRNAKTVEVVATAENAGFAIVGLECSFYDESFINSNAFEVVYQGTYTCRNNVRIYLLVSSKLERPSGMAIVTVSFPSGFVYSDILDSPAVEKVEPADDGSTVNLYLTTISSEPAAIRIEALRTSFVDQLMGGYVKVVDYYNPANQNIVDFVFPELTNTCGVSAKK